MIRRSVHLRILWFCLSYAVLGGLCAPIWAESIAAAPPSIQGVLLVKLLAFNQDVTQGGDITIYVLNAAEIAKALKPGVGRSIGKSVLKDIQECREITGLVPKRPAVLYVGKTKDIQPVLAFCRKHKILSITGVPAVGENGVSITMGIAAKKPRVLLDEKSVKLEGVTLDPKMKKLSKTR